MSAYHIQLKSPKRVIASAAQPGAEEAADLVRQQGQAEQGAR
jgi:hypothetical protein